MLKHVIALAKRRFHGLLWAQSDFWNNPRMYGALPALGQKLRFVVKRAGIGSAAAIGIC